MRLRECGGSILGLSSDSSHYKLFQYLETPSSKAVAIRNSFKKRQ